MVLGTFESMLTLGLFVLNWNLRLSMCKYLGLPNEQVSFSGPK